MCSLIQPMARYAYKWREIGTALNFTQGQLENIRMSFPTSNPHVLLLQVLTQWSQWPTHTHPDYPTMENLCNALRSDLVGLGALATQLQCWRSPSNSPLHDNTRLPSMPCLSCICIAIVILVILLLGILAILNCKAKAL